MIKHCNISSCVMERKNKYDVVPTDADRSAMWLAIRQGFVTLKTLEEVIYINYCTKSNVSARMIDLAVHGYFRKASYQGIKYGNQRRYDHRCYLPGIQAMRHLGLQGRPPRVDKDSAWIIYFGDNLIRQLNNFKISYKNIYTASQLKRNTKLTSITNFNPNISDGILLKDKMRPFHLVIRTTQGSHIYVYFMPFFVPSKKMKERTKQVIGPIKALMSELPKEDMLFIACPEEYHQHNSIQFSKKLAEPRVCLVTISNLAETILHAQQKQ